MKLEIGHFSVKDVRFGEKTAFADGILTVNREEAIAALNKDGKLKNVSLHLAGRETAPVLFPPRLRQVCATAPTDGAFFPVTRGRWPRQAAA